MQNKWLSKLSTVAAAAFMVCGTMFFASSASAQYCNNSTLHGAYGYISGGALLPAPGVSLQFRSTGVTHFHGDGTLSWVERTIVEGVPLGAGWQTATGTYIVHSNCTGTAIVITPNSPFPLHLSFVVVKEGKEVNSILDSNSVATQFTKVDD